MSTDKWKLWIAFLFLSVLAAPSFFMPGAAGAQMSVSSGSVAPLNPAFQKYLAEKKASPASVMPKTTDGHFLGYIPPRFKVPAPAEPTKPSAQATALPSKYDLRTASTVAPVHPVGVTAVRDQQMCGSCWAFGAMASLESNLKLRGTTADFSEADLNENHGWDPAVCMGGDETMATGYMTRWAGPVSEADMPYPFWLTEQGYGGPTGAAAQNATTAAPSVGAAPGVPTAYHIQNVYWLPQRSSSTDNATLKQAIIDNGAVAVSFYMDNAYYNATNHSFYCNDPSQGQNHEVAIVGWDNSYSKTKFNTQPPGNGAFILKNSWGTGWGANGYFFMSYYDQSLSLDAQFYDPQPATKYSRIYQYDPLGLTTFWSPTYSPVTKAWLSNVFMASANAGKIKAVSLYTSMPNVQYVVKIYSGVAGSTPSKMDLTGGTLVRSKSGTIVKSGYNTIPLTAAVVAAGKPFSVVVKLTMPTAGYPIGIEYADGWHGTTAGGGCPGQSYVSADGATWSYANDFKVCLKAFAVQ